jgi:uncharacterized protein YjdB
MKLTLLAKQIRHYLIPKGLFAIILNLILHRADRRQWNLNIGSYLLRKGVGWEIGQIIKKERLTTNITKVTYITGFSYNFEKNKVIHRTGAKLLKTNEKRG